MKTPTTKKDPQNIWNDTQKKNVTTLFDDKTRRKRKKSNLGFTENLSQFDEKGPPTAQERQALALLGLPLGNFAVNILIFGNLKPSGKLITNSCFLTKLAS